MKQLQSFGIILRRLDYGEADRIITFLTDEYGKITVMAKGVRRQKSKLAGGVELFSVSELHFIEGRKDMGTLISTRLKHYYGNIVKDYDRTKAAYEMLRVLYKVLEDRTGQEFYKILEESLAALNDPDLPRILAEHSFDMRILQLLGHAPEFTVDQNGRRLDEAERYNFDYETVAFVPHNEGLFTQNHIKLLRLLMHNNPAALKAVQGLEQFCNELKGLVTALAQFYVPARADN